MHFDVAEEQSVAREAPLSGELRRPLDLSLAVRKESGSYYPAFDYLRIILATVVVAGHSHLIGWEQSGNFSVQVFFALSGWLIGGILLETGPSQLPRFYFNRAARIWIPYFVAIGALMVVSLLKEHVTAKWIEIFFYDSTFVYNFFGAPQLDVYKNAMPLQATGNHFWSICAEEQFYLLAPFLITLLPRKIGKHPWFWALLAIAALTSPYWGYFASISLGVLASVLRRNLGDWHSTKVARLILAVLVVGFFIATYENLIVYRVGAPLTAISIVLLLAQAGRHSSAASFLGGVSYPMYLNHWLGIFAANAIFARFAARDTWLCHFAGVLLAVLFAMFLYWFIDRRVRKRRDRYFTTRRGIILAATGFTLVVSGAIVGLTLSGGVVEPPQ
jgi:peptidoglycan/LPS O-acetylase OafA/YrhL